MFRAWCIPLVVGQSSYPVNSRDWRLHLYFFVSILTPRASTLCDSETRSRRVIYEILVCCFFFFGSRAESVLRTCLGGKLSCNLSRVLRLVACIAVRCLRCLRETSFTLLAYRAGHWRYHHIPLYTIINLHFNETSLYIHKLVSIWNSYLDSKIFIADIDNENPISAFTPLRSTTAHRLRHLPPPFPPPLTPPALTLPLSWIPSFQFQRRYDTISGIQIAIQAVNTTTIPRQRR